MEELTSAELGQVSSEIADRFFRAGLLLGLAPSELDRLEIDATRQGCNAWQKNMQLLQTWRERTSAGSERLELAKVLKRLGKGRLAVKMQPSVREWEPQSVLDPAKDSLSALELEEISREGRVTECWNQLAVHLNVADSRVREIESRIGEEPSVKAFRCVWAWREAGENVSKASLAEALRKVNLGRLASRIYPAR